jgi:hypothetical protein
MSNIIVGAGAAGDASRYGSGYDQNMRLLAVPAPAPQHWPPELRRHTTLLKISFRYAL